MLSYAVSALPHTTSLRSSLQPVFHGLSEEHEGIVFGQIDVDDNQDAAAEANIRSVPTFAAWKGGEKVAEFAGADEGHNSQNHLSPDEPDAQPPPPKKTRAASAC